MFIIHMVVHITFISGCEVTLRTLSPLCIIFFENMCTFPVLIIYVSSKCCLIIKSNLTERAVITVIMCLPYMVFNLTFSTRPKVTLGKPRTLQYSREQYNKAYYCRIQYSAVQVWSSALLPWLYLCLATWKEAPWARPWILKTAASCSMVTKCFTLMSWFIFNR